MSYKSTCRRNTIYTLSDTAQLNIATGSGFVRIDRQAIEVNEHKCFITYVFTVLENVFLWVNIDVLEGYTVSINKVSNLRLIHQT
jgi:hypothetical protein